MDGLDENDGDDSTDVSTMRGRDYPAIRQFSIFQPNKVGQLLRLMRVVETARLRVCAISIQDSAECSIIRLVVTQPERARELFEQKGYKFCETDLLAVELPNRDQPILSICQNLLRAEVNIHYSFPLMSLPEERPAMAFHVDDIEMASGVLSREGFTLITENDLEF